MEVTQIKEKTVAFLKKIDRQIIFIAFVTTIMICYYINPLININITEWDRTFSSALLSGFSINKRIGNFYLLFFLYTPLVFIAVLCTYYFLFAIRQSYQESWLKINILCLFSAVAVYLSRYASGSSEVNSSLLLGTILAFYLVLLAVALLDKEQILDFSNLVTLFVADLIAVISSNILLRTETRTSIYVVGVLLIAYVAFVLYTPIGQKVFAYSMHLIFLLLWMPALLRLALEGIYFLTEKGWTIQRYYTHIGRVAVVFVILAAIIAWPMSRKSIRGGAELGYIGSIVSLGALGSFSYSYQYVWSYSKLNAIYEMGNAAVASDTILHGKLPVIDYFSAHALADVWTRIVYCLIHSDIKGIFVNPYGGLESVLAYLCLFYIIKSLFNRDIAVLFVCLFPTSIVGVKFTSMCFLAVAMLIFIVKKPGFKNSLFFWISALTGAFFVYDEGISLGIACILTYLFTQCLTKEWRNLKSFILSGMTVGGAALIFYFIYCLATGLDFVFRFKEWMSVSLGSSSTWAMADFGETSSFAFLLSYFIVPMCAITILVLAVFQFIKQQDNELLAMMTMIFAMAEVLYITRTIVYHNLAVGSGTTGVLLNFIHWSVSLYVLYSFAIKKAPEPQRLLAWISALGMVVIAEGALVTDILPGNSSVMYAKAVNASEGWGLKNDTTLNWGQERIVFDESTAALVNQFQTIFDTLLSEEQTFIDFANVTSLYALTGRERPCYVGQTPSLLTDLYSQECYLKEVQEYDCPLAVLGTTQDAYLLAMAGVPHRIRYYKIAEYIYANYRPLVTFGEFVIWCDKESYRNFYERLNGTEDISTGYGMVDYGYDAVSVCEDEEGKAERVYSPAHSCRLGKLPYVWANYDDYDAVHNAELVQCEKQSSSVFIFEGSQTVTSGLGNYVVFECTNNLDRDTIVAVDFQDSGNEGIQFQYFFLVVPGTEQYMIRVSGDYFWSAYNIDTVSFVIGDGVAVGNVRVLEGD